MDVFANVVDGTVWHTARLRSVFRVIVVEVLLVPAQEGKGATHQTETTSAMLAQYLPQSGQDVFCGGAVLLLHLALLMVGISKNLTRQENESSRYMKVRSATPNAMRC